MNWKCLWFFWTWKKSSIKDLSQYTYPISKFPENFACEFSSQSVIKTLPCYISRANRQFSISEYFDWLFRNQMNIHTINRQNIYICFFCSVFFFVSNLFSRQLQHCLMDQIKKNRKKTGEKILANWSDVSDKAHISQTLSRCCQEVWISLYFRGVNLLNNISFLFCASSFCCILHKFHNWCLWNFLFP